MEICKLEQADVGYAELLFFSGIAEDLEARHNIKNHFDATTAYDMGCEIWLAKDPEIKGTLVTEFFIQPFTKERVLYQRLLYAVTPRATVALMHHFLDYGKKNANSILSVVNDHSNLKDSSLIKFGFKKFETVYRLEV